MASKQHKDGSESAQQGRVTSYTSRNNGQWTDGAAESSQRGGQQQPLGRAQEPKPQATRSVQVFTNNDNIPPVNPQAKVIEDRFVEAVQDAKKSDVAQTVEHDDSFTILRRPTYGTEQVKEPTVSANYFPVFVNKDTEFHMYTIQVQPEIPRIAQKQRIVKDILLTKGTYFDEHQSSFYTNWSGLLISTHEIPEDYLLFEQRLREGQVQQPPNRPLYKVRLQSHQVISVRDLIEDLESGALETQEKNPELILMALNMLISHHPRMSPDCVLVGANKTFWRNSPENVDRHPECFLVIDGGLQASKGFFRSVRPVAGGLALNVNVTTGIFHRVQTLDKSIQQLLRPRPYDVKKRKADIFHVGSGIRNLRVRLPHRERVDIKTGEKIKVVRSVLSLASKEDETRAPALSHQSNIKKIERTIGTIEKRTIFDEGRKRDCRVGWGPSAISFWLNENLPATQQGIDESKQSDTNQSGTLITGGRYITVSEYFEMKYGHTCVPQNPVINVGSRDKPEFVPSELCVIEAGQYYCGPLSDTQVRQISGISCKRPWENAKFITESAPEMFGFENNDILKSFQVSVKKTLMTVKARMLSPPTLLFGRNASMVPRNGKWNMQNKIFFQTRKKPISTAFLNISGMQISFDEASKIFTKEFNKYGLKLAASPLICEANISFDAERVLDESFRKFDKTGIELVVIGLPSDDAFLYNIIKRLGDRRYGIQTCDTVVPARGKLGSIMKSVRNGHKLTPNDQGYFSNLAVKVNSKFGGTNHTIKGDKLGIPLQGKKVMIVGMDVTHPPKDAKADAPSIAGMVATIDSNYMQYHGETCGQRYSKVEMIFDTDKMFLGRLEHFKELNGSYPDCILIYRDGVSESQLQQVLKYELHHIDAVCAEVYTKSLPKIKFVVCVKTHHARVYASDIADADNTGNLRSGVVVERTITDFHIFEFLLQAQIANLGTACPRKYQVLRNEPFSTNTSLNEADEIERMTYNLCFIHPRSSTPVGDVTAVALADAICGRAKILIADSVWNGEKHEPRYVNKRFQKPKLPFLALDSRDAANDKHLKNLTKRLDSKEQVMPEDQWGPADDDVDASENACEILADRGKGVTTPQTQANGGSSSSTINDSPVAPNVIDSKYGLSYWKDKLWRMDMTKAPAYPPHFNKKTNASLMDIITMTCDVNNMAIENDDDEVKKGDKQQQIALAAAQLGSSEVTSPKGVEKALTPETALQNLILSSSHPKGPSLGLTQLNGDQKARRRPAYAINQNEDHERWLGAPVKQEYLDAIKVHPKVRDTEFYI